MARSLPGASHEVCVSIKLRGFTENKHIAQVTLKGQPIDYLQQNHQEGLRHRSLDSTQTYPNASLRGGLGVAI